MDMKKSVLFVLMFLVLVGFVVAPEPDAPSVGTESDYEAIQGAVDKLPIDPEGKANFSQYKPFYSKAEKRIEAINGWLDSNVAWLGPVFHMRPRLSWAFAFNIYFLLLFLLLLFLNAEDIWFWFDEEKFARMFGGGLFVILLVTGFYAYLANLVLNVLAAVWNTLVVSLAAGLVLAVFVVVIVALVIFLGGGSVLLYLKNVLAAWSKARKEKRHKARVKATEEAFETVTKAATKT